jgi:SAM-dependent methyltransferase
MISTKLGEIIRCPTCLEILPETCRRFCSERCVAGCPQGALSIPEGRWLADRCEWCLDCVVKCPFGAVDKALLIPDEYGEELTCSQCGTKYPVRNGYIDLLPRSESLGHTSKYLEEELAESLDYKVISPPYLAAAVRNDVLKSWLTARRRGRVLDIGCGNGKFAVWNRERYGFTVGVDGAPLFADKALETVDLVRGDVRWLPFATASFDYAYSIDVMEHLADEDIASYFREARRVLAPQGRLLLYSNTREKSSLGPIISAQKRVSRFFVRRGYYSFERDNQRKADHVKAIRTFEELRARLQDSGLVVEKKLFWNGVFQGFIENVVVKLGEARLGGKKGAKSAGPKTVTERELAARSVARQRIAQGRRFRLVLRFLTRLMKLDLLLFGHLRSGPFFVLLRKTDT